MPPIQDASPVSPILIPLPLATAAGAVALIAECRRQAVANGHVPPGVEVPPISLFGYAEPEYTLYARGFLAVSVAFCLMAAPLYGYLKRHAETPVLAADVEWAAQCAFAAFAGLAVHGAVPLQRNVLDLAAGRAAELETTSIVHQLGALAFFAGSMGHALALGRVLDGSRRLAIRSELCPFARGCKRAALACLGLPLLVSLVTHPTAVGSVPLGPAAHALRERLGRESGGVSQWTAVGALIAFYATYSLDFYNIWASERARSTSRQQEQVANGDQEDHFELEPSGCAKIFNADGGAWKRGDGRDSYRRCVRTGKLVYYGGAVVTARKSAGGRAPRRPRGWRAAMGGAADGGE